MSKRTVSLLQKRKRKLPSRRTKGMLIDWNVKYPVAAGLLSVSVSLSLARRGISRKAILPNVGDGGSDGGCNTVSYGRNTRSREDTGFSRLVGCISFHLSPYLSQIIINITYIAVILKKLIYLCRNFCRSVSVVRRVDSGG